MERGSRRQRRRARTTDTCNPICKQREYGRLYSIKSLGYWTDWWNADANLFKDAFVLAQQENEALFKED